MVTCMKLTATAESQVIGWKRRHTWEPILVMLLLKSLIALTGVSKYTVPGYTVRHTSCWKITPPWKWVTSLDSHAHTVFNHADGHTRLCSKTANTHYISSAVLAVIPSLLCIVPSDGIDRIPEEPQMRHMGDTQCLGFRVEVGLNDVARSKDWVWRVLEWISRTRPSWPCAGRGVKWSSVYISVCGFCACALMRNRTGISVDKMLIESTFERRRGGRKAD